MVSIIPTTENDSGTARTNGSSADVEIISSGQVLHVRVTGNSSLMPYSDFAVAVDSQVRHHGRVCVLLEILDLEGCNSLALWQTETGDFKAQRFDCGNIESGKVFLQQKITGGGQGPRT